MSVKISDFTPHKKILGAVSGKINEYYLVGGTALSMIYFQHRSSCDLDFFTKEFSRERVLQIVDELKKNLDASIELIGERNQKNMIQISLYLAHFADGSVCKIDFVEDCVELIHPAHKVVNGINILSLEDIYLRKIYAIAGHISSVDSIGREIMVGGRQEAKDFYDLFCLSSITLSLSEFVTRYCSAAIQEGLIHWYRTYDRMTIKTGLLDLETTKKIDFKIIDHHFEKEITELINMQLGFGERS